LQTSQEYTSGANIPTAQLGSKTLAKKMSMQKTSAMHEGECQFHQQLGLPHTGRDAGERIEELAPFFQLVECRDFQCEHGQRHLQFIQ
jgi:hypothetical protein